MKKNTEGNSLTITIMKNLGFEKRITKECKKRLTKEIDFVEWWLA